MTEAYCVRQTTWQNEKGQTISGVRILRRDENGVLIGGAYFQDVETALDTAHMLNLAREDRLSPE